MGILRKINEALKADRSQVERVILEPLLPAELKQYPHQWQWDDAGTIEAAAEPSSFRIEASSVEFDVTAKAADGSPKLPSFSILAYTGSVINLGNFFSPLIVDLTGLKAAAQEIPIFRDHDSSRIVGQTNSVKIDAQGVRETGIITGENEDSREVVSQSRNGFLWRASIGASVDRREFLDAGKKATVNGREITGPMIIVREATLSETSFVAIGADNQTAADVAASLNQGRPPMNPFEVWLQSRGIDPLTLNDAVRAALRAGYDAEQRPAPPPPTPQPTPQPTQTQTQTLDQVLQAHHDENRRQSEIARITQERIAARPVLLDRFEQLARTAVAARSTVQEFELNALRLSSDYAPSVFSHSGADAIGQRVLEAAVCISGRLQNIDRHFDARTLEAAHTHFRHGLGLVELLQIGAREHGYTGFSRHDTDALLRGAFPPRDIRAEGFSNINIPGTLSNVMNKFLVDHFNNVESAWRSVCAIRNARDFKQISIYSLTGDLTYEIVGPTGELKSGVVAETAYHNQVNTYGKILAITRQDIVNDDLSALTRIPARLGRGGALKINDLVWTAFLAGVGTFWSAGNNNFITGAGTALSAAGLQAGLLAFRKQTDPDGKPLGLTPAVLLTPPELEVTAKQLMESTNFNTGGSSTLAQVPNANTWQGSYQPVASVYLSNPLLTGYSQTAWWLLANPADLPSIELAALNGKEYPTIESAEAMFNVLGIAVRGFHDVGASLMEPRGSVRAQGT